MKRLLFVVGVVLPLFFLSSCSSVPQNSVQITRGAWSHFKRTFIMNGRVFRPHNSFDTVSEGEAYGMLRAALVGDRETFDACFAWTDRHLSRLERHGDHLLAWHYGQIDGKPQLLDSKAASDADVDYAYSLILAWRQWHDERYMVAARDVLDSVLELETRRYGGRLYFLPWPASYNDESTGLVELNPSYYSPSHFKLFYEVTHDPRWLELVDTTYDLMGRLLSDTLQQGGVVPDWVTIDLQGNLVSVPGKPVAYGWDAVRVPLRIAADYHLHGDERALAVLRWFASWFERQKSGGESAEPVDREKQNALFFSAEYAALEAVGSPFAAEVLQKLRERIHQKEDGYYFDLDDDYYINSLSWLPDFYQSNSSRRQMVRGKQASLPPNL